MMSVPTIDDEKRSHPERRLEHRVTQLFNEDKLLVRAMDSPRIYRNGQVNFGPWDSELDQLTASGNIPHLSTTLLVRECAVRTYKPIGFLVDSDLCEIEHVADDDSASGVDGNGTFYASATDLSTLRDLAVRVRRQQSSKMNEVNITMPQEALMGLVFLEAPYDIHHRISVIAIMLHLRTQGLDLPIFMYSIQKGTLRLWENPENHIDDLIPRLSVHGDLYKLFFQKLQAGEQYTVSFD